MGFLGGLENRAHRAAPAGWPFNSRSNAVQWPFRRRSTAVLLPFKCRSTGRSTGLARKACEPPKIHWMDICSPGTALVRFCPKDIFRLRRSGGIDREKDQTRTYTVFGAQSKRPSNGHFDGRLLVVRCGNQMMGWILAGIESESNRKSNDQEYW